MNHELRAGRSHKQASLACRAFLSDIRAEKPAEVLRRLQRLATMRGRMFEVVQCGRHAKVRLNGRFAPVPRYAAHLPGGTLRSILKLLGVTAADLEERATRYAYPVEVLEKADGITVTCPDVPEMVTGGWGDVAANLKAAEDALATALSGYVDDGRAIPRPSPVEGRPVVAIDTLAAAKLALHEAILEQGISNVELAGRLGLDEKAVRRLRDPLHRSHIGAVETALRVLGRRFVLEIA